MRKREIHSVAHWAMMFLLLMFPILMVGLSTFGKDETTFDINYQYESNDVDTLSDLIVGRAYTYTFDENISQECRLGIEQVLIVDDLSSYNFKNISVNYDTTIRTNYTYEGVTYNSFVITPMNATFNGYTNNNTIDFIYGNTQFNQNADVIIACISRCDNLPILDYSINQESYKYDVNNWCDQFLDLPINAWYKSLMNVIGVGFTSSTVMNVIYVMPVYILWVFIFDVIVDCFLVIIKLPHKLLNRLSGGENE